MKNFSYSTFISYRRNIGDKRFLENFKKIVQSEALRVTNIPSVFFDEDSIEWGIEFDEKIYQSIMKSCFFIPIYHFGYLHIDNVWCARELYHALEVEKVIRKTLGNNNYYYVLPIIFRGKPSALPNCIGKKNAKEIGRLEAAIAGNRINQKLNEFKNFIYDTFLASFKLLEEKNIDLIKICAGIAKPTDFEIKKWIEEQKKIEKSDDVANLPILRKDAE